MKKPIKPRKPAKPTEPTKPEKFIFLDVEYDIHLGTKIKDLPRFMIDQAKRESPDAEIVKEITIEDIEYTENYFGDPVMIARNCVRVPNDNYDYHQRNYRKEFEKYQKRLERYNKKMKEYSEAMKIYHSDLEKYKKHIESEDHKNKLKEYHKLKKELNL